MYGNFRTDAEKDEIARQYLEKRKERNSKKNKRVCQKWFPGPACKVSRLDTEKVKAGPEFSAIATLKKTDEWKKEDTNVAEACTIEWVKNCFDENPELCVAKVPYLHGVLWQNFAVSRDGTHPVMLCDHTGQIEVRLHEHLIARYRKEMSNSEPAILMKRLTIFRSDKEFYAACSLQNFIHLVAGDTLQNPDGLTFTSSFPLQYGSQTSELELTQTLELSPATPKTVELSTQDDLDGEGLTQAVLLPSHGDTHGKISNIEIGRLIEFT